jgi:hypothetical protein
MAVRYSYEKNPPSRGKRVEMMKAMLGEALDRLESGKPTDLGFAEDAVRRIRTDQLGT